MAFEDRITPIIAGKYCIRMVENEEELKKYQNLRYRHLLCEWDPEKAKEVCATDENIGYDKTTSQICAFYINPETKEQELIGGFILMRFLEEDSFCKATLKYDLSKLLKKHKFQILEATRAIVHPNHRDSMAMLLLWRGIIEYAKKYDLRFIIGTLSFCGTDAEKYQDAASYLFHNYRMPEDILVRPLDCDNAYYHEIIPNEELNHEEAKGKIPPLLRSMLRFGAEVGEGFYIDHELKTVETFTILDMNKVKNYGFK
jgi:putative hemolysin